MNKFNSLLFLLLFAFGCSPSPEQIKKQIDSIYTDTKSIPASEPCRNLDGYKKLKETEDKFNTSYYLETSLQNSWGSLLFFSAAFCICIPCSSVPVR